MKRPSIGDTIEHTEIYFDRQRTGVVIQVLALQFVYEADGNEHFCMFNENWKIKETKNERIKQKTM